MEKKQRAPVERRKAKDNGKHPGGRPPFAEKDLLRQRSVRMTAAQWEKIGRMGGFEWVRRLVDKAREPAARAPSRALGREK